MLKYLGSVGTFIRLNDNENKTYKLLEIFSSSAASELLFSASINNFNGSIKINTASTSLYINGLSASVLPSEQWAHLTISFDNKLWTYDNNNFLIRFGDTASSNFNIQNMYMMESSLLNNDASYLNYAFTGGGDKVLRVNDSASFSINIIDPIENNFISSFNNTIYQPFNNQKQYLFDIVAATQDSLSMYVSSSIMTNDRLYIDGFNIITGNKILSFTDNQIYELTASSTLLPISSSTGDFVKILSGNQYSDLFYLMTSGSFINVSARKKVNTFIHTLDTNNA